MIKSIIKKIVPSRIYSELLALFKKNLKPVHWGNLRRTSPFSTLFGFDRGKPIDRYYIENFLQKHSSDICGRVLEIGDPGYTLRYGGDRVAISEVLHAKPGNPQATLVGDLETGQGLSNDSYDCMILTQTFNVIYNLPAAISHSYASLKPNGVLLATIPGISQVSRYDMDRWGDHWRLTDNSARRLFGDVFGEKNVVVEVYGNVLTACAFLLGLAATELKPEELDTRDPNYQVTITVRAQKPG
jgi:hypothetical protein